mgnify:CR=1 FL=1
MKMKELAVLFILSFAVTDLSSQTIDSTLLQELNTLSEKDPTFTIPDFSFFKFSLMTDEQGTRLETILAYLSTSTVSLEMVIHTDCRGNSDYNDAVTKRKADIMQRWFLRRGVGKDRLLIKGGGENFPLITCEDCSSCTDQEHDQNSRIELIYKK